MDTRTLLLYAELNGRVFLRSHLRSSFLYTFCQAQHHNTSTFFWVAATSQQIPTRTKLVIWGVPYTHDGTPPILLDTIRSSCRPDLAKLASSGTVSSNMCTHTLTKHPNDSKPASNVGPPTLDIPVACLRHRLLGAHTGPSDDAFIILAIICTLVVQKIVRCPGYPTQNRYTYRGTVQRHGSSTFGSLN